MAVFVEIRTIFNVVEGPIYPEDDSLGPMPKVSPLAIERCLVAGRCSELIEGWKANSWFIRTDTRGDWAGRLIGVAQNSAQSGGDISRTAKAIRLRQRSGRYREVGASMRALSKPPTPAEKKSATRSIVAQAW